METKKWLEAALFELWEDSSLASAQCQLFIQLIWEPHCGHGGTTWLCFRPPPVPGSRSAAFSPGDLRVQVTGQGAAQIVL